MTGSYNNFFRMFDRSSRKEVTYEASKEIAKPKTILKPRKVRKIFLLFSFEIHYAERDDMFYEYFFPLKFRVLK